MSGKKCAEWKTFYLGDWLSVCFFEKGTLEEGEQGWLSVPIPKCKEP